MPTFRFRHDVAAKATNAAKKVDDKNPEDLKEKNRPGGATREKIEPGAEATMPESSAEATAEPDNQDGIIAANDDLTETVATEDTAMTDGETLQQAVEPASDENIMDIENPFANETAGPDQVVVEPTLDVAVAENVSTSEVTPTEVAAGDFDSLFDDPLVEQTPEEPSSSEIGLEEKPLDDLQTPGGEQEASIAEENTDLVNDLKAELIKELREELKDELRAELKEELKAELKAKLKAELRSKLKSDPGTEES